MLIDVAKLSSKVFLLISVSTHQYVSEGWSLTVYWCISSNALKREIFQNKWTFDFFFLILFYF